MDFLLSASENKLCDNCTSLLRCCQRAIQSNLNENIRRVHHENSRSFFTAGRNGCRICDILWRYHLRAHGNDSDEAFGTMALLDHSSHPVPSAALLILTVTHKTETWMPDSQLRLDVFPEDDPVYSFMLKNCRSFPLGEFMDSDDSTLASKWLTDCITNSATHVNCNRPSTSGFRPRRLLDIRGDSLCLSLEADRAGKESYCALSYCWGEGDPQLKLTAMNEDEFCQKIDFALLSKTIQDAIRVTRRLSIGFIWVDSLCIIQAGDEGQDWTQHLSVMSNVYSNCILNLSADRARSAVEGFLGPRTWPALRPIFGSGEVVENSTVPPKKYVAILNNVADVAIASEPLASRGWVLSERILSPRTLHFCAGEMFWECAQSPNGILSESCPSGFATFQHNVDYTNYCLTSSDMERDQIEDWVMILTNYSRLSLSNPHADKLVALAGVARLYEESTGNILVAGILKSTLPLSLLWFRGHSTPPVIERSSTYRAPSWSWANMDGPLFFYWSRDFFGDSRDVAKVLEVSTKPVEGHSHLGQLEDGSIEISGPVCLVGDLDQLMTDFSKRNSRGFDSECFWDEPDRVGPTDAALALFLNVVDGGNKARATAIIISRIKNGELWRRVGVLILRFTGDSSTSPTHTSGCQEFLDERSVKRVTIV